MLFLTITESYARTTEAVSDGSQLFRFTPQQPAHRPFQFRSSRARLRTSSAALRKSTDLLSDFRIPCLRIILDNVHQQKSGHPHSLRLQDSRRQHGWCSKVSSLSAAPPRRDTAASAAGLKRIGVETASSVACVRSSLQHCVRRLDSSLPHRPTGAKIRPALFVPI